MSMIGKTLAHYEVTSQLGKGGMGEVYQAKDRKLGRDVAIKLLPEEFARDADRVARFQREAKLLASLNHPNIAAIHGLEESGGTNFLVLELVEGDTLADQIKRGPIPVEKSLKLALQIAEALEAAHEKGVIHRDLKPANIKITPDGKVKVLDFGLAKAFASDQTDLNLSNSPTLTRSPTLSAAATQQGIILGTAAYMSPEQAKGKTVDKRADIWAFGVVLFEMLTGRQLFTGETVSETLAAVLMREPDFSILSPNMHQRIRLLLERCLEKEPKNRYHDIADVRVDIQKAIADPSGVLVQPITGVKPRRRLRLGLPWIAAIVALSAVIAGAAVWKFKPPEPRQVVRFNYELPEGQRFSDLGNPSIAISPDGSKFAYITSDGLCLRTMDQQSARLILSADIAPKQPFFSPDGQWVGYWSEAEKKLKKISVSGGAPVSIADTSANPALPSWGVDDRIVYGQFGTGKIMRVPANGGTPELLCEMKANMLFSPQILPDGKSVLVSQYDFSKYRIILQSLKSGQGKELISVEGTVSRYLPTGHIVYMVGNSLFAVPFNLAKLEVAGGSVPMVEGIVWQGGTGAPQFAISESGTLVYISATARAAVPNQRTLVWVDRNGKEESLGVAPNDYGGPSISPDGMRIALSAGTDIYIWNVVRKNLTRLTFDKKDARTPIWTPDGKRIVYYSNHENEAFGGVYWKAADGTGAVEKLASMPDRTLFPWSMSSDGKTLVLQEVISMTNTDISILPVEGDQTRKPLIQTEYLESAPKVSPDGQWLAYSSHESGKSEIYVRPFPEVNKGKWQVSAGYGTSPLWAPDGRELFYLSADSAMAVAVETKPTLSFATPKVLFRNTNISFSFLGTSWDIHPDGKRFLMMKPLAPTGATPAAAVPRKISIVLNWFEELKQRVPVK
jgi:serine/threonine protein kinase/WD40 repeat protein